MKGIISTLVIALLSFGSSAQSTYDVYHNGDTITVTLEDPLRDQLPVDEYFCYRWTDTEGGAFNNFDFNGNGLVDISDFLTVLQTYGGQIQITTILDILSQFGTSPEAIDAPDLNVFELDNWFSSGFLCWIPDSLEYLVFEDRVETYPYSADDFIGQYTNSDETWSTQDCPEDEWVACMVTFKYFLFVLDEESGNVYVESYYMIRL